MLELCFDNSTRGSLCIAQHCAESHAGGAFGVVFCTAEGERRPALWARRRAIRQARQEAEERRKHAVSLGGNPGDVLALSLGLDQGDIRAPLAAECPRKDLLRRMYEGHTEALEGVWRDTLTTAARLRSLRAGETVRIWASGREPHAACGLLFAAELLRDTPAEIRIVSLPPWRERPDGTVVQYMGWGEVHPEEFGRFLPLEQSLSPMAVRMLASRWQELKEENAPLRAVVNGEVRSVEEDFYDHLIRKHLPEGETRIGVLIGNVLGRERPGIGDVWLAGRIRRMLETGELRMIREDPEMFYRSVVEKTAGQI